MIGCVPAYVDESGRTSGGGRYVMAAVVVPPERAEAVRAALRDALPSGLHRYHWHHERAASRLAMAARVRDLGLDAVVVTTAPVEPRRTERARRRCLLRLLWELDQREERQVVFESRRAGDADDRRAVAVAERAAHVRAPVRYAFLAPTEEPLLWLPDCVAGAATRALADGDTTYLDLLGERVEVVTLC